MHTQKFTTERLYLITEGKAYRIAEPKGWEKIDPAKPENLPRLEFQNGAAPSLHNSYALIRDAIEKDGTNAEIYFEWRGRDGSLQLSGRVDLTHYQLTEEAAFTGLEHLSTHN